MLKGKLNLVKNLFIGVFVVFLLVVCDGNVIYFIYFVNWFIIIKMFEFFVVDLGKGFEKLRWIFFIGI